MCDLSSLASLSIILQTNGNSLQSCIPISYSYQPFIRQAIDRLTLMLPEVNSSPFTIQIQVRGWHTFANTELHALN